MQTNRRVKFNLVDLAIVVMIILAGFLAFTRTGGNTQTFTFDGSDIGRASRKYIDLDQQGYIVRGRVAGIDARSGQPVNVEGTFVWGSSGMFVLDTGEKFVSVGGPAGRYEEVFAKSIVLESAGRVSVENIVLEPKRITDLMELVPEGAGNDIKIHTQVSLAETDPVKLQEVISTLRAQRGYVSVYPLAVSHTLNIEGASREDLAIAAGILGELDGMSDVIITRVYGDGLNE